MEIKSKFELGQRVWLIFKNEEHKELELFSDTIENIIIDSKKTILYFMKEFQDEVAEEDVIAYEDTDKLLKKIIAYDNEFRKD